MSGGAFLVRMDSHATAERALMQHYGCETLSLNPLVSLMPEEEDPACCVSSVCHSLRAFLPDWWGQRAGERLAGKLK